MTKEQRAMRLKAQCATALGLLEAAMLLVDRASTEAPMAGITDQCRIIDKHIQALQRTLLRTHDEGR
jgi:hypothetical protein